MLESTIDYTTMAKELLPPNSKVFRNNRNMITS